MFPSRSNLLKYNFGHLVPNKGNNMNDFTQDTAVTEVGVAEAPVLIFNEATGQFEDALGNPVETTEAGFVTTEGDTAQLADVTVTTIH